MPRKKKETEAVETQFLYELWGMDLELLKSITLQLMRESYTMNRRPVMQTVTNIGLTSY